MSVSIFSTPFSVDINRSNRSFKLGVFTCKTCGRLPLAGIDYHWSCCQKSHKLQYGTAPARRHFGRRNSQRALGSYSSRISYEARISCLVYPIKTVRSGSIPALRGAGAKRGIYPPAQAHTRPALASAPLFIDCLEAILRERNSNSRMRVAHRLRRRPSGRP